MVTFLQRTFTSLVHAHAGRTPVQLAELRELSPFLQRYAKNGANPLRPQLQALEVSRDQKLKIISVIFLFFVGVYGCSIFPKFEYEKAAENIPAVIEYAKKEVVLSRNIISIIENSKPLIGHSNYVIYYYRWQNPSGKDILIVETGSPENGFVPYRAYVSQKN